MKNLLLVTAIFVIAGFALLNLNSCSSPTPTNTTTIEHDTVYQHYWDPEQTPASGLLINVCFPTLKVGTAVGAAGTIVQTTDGGNTWSLGNSGASVDLYGVSFANVSTGLVVGSSGVVLLTIDGGVSWSPLPVDNSVNFRNVLMVDSKNAYAIGMQYNGPDNTVGFVYKTTDGGLSWKQLTLPSAPGLYGIAFSGLLSGWVTGLDGTIFHTTDAGATWTKQNSTVPITQIIPAISFADANHGIAVGMDGIAGISTPPVAGFILTTSDGGATWTKTMTTPMDGVSMPDTKHAIATGFEGTIMETIDGGQSWTTKSVGTLRLLNIFMNDANDGAVVGENGQVFMLGAH